MGRQLILETTFLIDLERDARRELVGPATDFLEAERDSSLFVTFTVAGELAAGMSLGERAIWEHFLGPFHTLPSTDDVCWEYGKLHRYLADNGLLIGANDLWIASTAIAYGMPVVTRNEAHFRRAPNLRVVTYS